MLKRQEELFGGLKEGVFFSNAKYNLLRIENHIDKLVDVIGFASLQKYNGMHGTST